MDISDLSDVRAIEPQRISLAWAARRRRSLLGTDGRLLLVAADHPARAALGVGGDPRAMSSRSDLLRRLVLALSRPGVDGVLATADVLDDLVLLGVLSDKVVIGSMNRGGLQGASFEMDDRFTGHTASQIVASGLDGGKMLVRIDLQDAGTVATLASCAQAVTELADGELMAMVEPFLSTRIDGRVQNLLDPENTITAIQVASGLGASSAYSWLKLPVVQQLERVLDATTLPTLLLGGDPPDDQRDAQAAWGRAMKLPQVRGLVVGRSLLYPADGDVGTAVDIAAELVHGGGR